jgi:hypothetical protein
MVETAEMGAVALGKAGILVGPERDARAEGAERMWLDRDMGKADAGDRRQ